MQSDFRKIFLPNWTKFSKIFACGAIFPSIRSISQNYIPYLKKMQKFLGYFCLIMQIFPCKIAPILNNCWNFFLEKAKFSKKISPAALFFLKILLLFGQFLWLFAHFFCSISMIIWPISLIICCGAIFAQYRLWGNPLHIRVLQRP